MKMKMKTFLSFSGSHFRALSLSLNFSLSVCCAGVYFQLSDVHEATRCALQLVLLRRQLRPVVPRAACCHSVSCSVHFVYSSKAVHVTEDGDGPRKQHKLNTPTTAATTINSNNCCQQQQQHRERLLPPAKYLKLFWAKHKRNSRRGPPKSSTKSSKQKRRVLPLGVCVRVLWCILVCVCVSHVYA